MIAVGPFDPASFAQLVWNGMLAERNSWPAEDIQELGEGENDDYMKALDLPMCNLETERGQPTVNKWQVQEKVGDKENDRKGKKETKIVWVSE